jgi:Na+-driven multidrug efflux pump
VVDASSGTQGISDYQSVYGAINAIANLFWTALFGIINGARIICSYSYGARNFKRVRDSYWILIAYTLVYCTFAFALVCYATNTFFLGLFDIDKSSTVFNLANYILKISISQMCITTIGIGGMTLFQATGRWWRAAIAGIMQGIIYCLPLSFLLQYCAVQSHNVDLFLWCPFIIVSCSAITNLVWSTIYIHFHFLDKHAKIAATLKNVKSVEQEETLLKRHVD